MQTRKELLRAEVGRCELTWSIEWVFFGEARSRMVDGGQDKVR